MQLQVKQLKLDVKPNKYIRYFSKFESFIEENSAHVFSCKPQCTHEKPNVIPSNAHHHL
jgi:hypothetical protein